MAAPQTAVDESLTTAVAPKRLLVQGSSETRQSYPSACEGLFVSGP